MIRYVLKYLNFHQRCGSGSKLVPNSTTSLIRIYTTKIGGEKAGMNSKNSPSLFRTFFECIYFEQFLKMFFKEKLFKISIFHIFSIRIRIQVQHIWIHDTEFYLRLLAKKFRFSSGSLGMGGGGLHWPTGPAHRVYERALLVAPESLLAPAAVVIGQLQAPARYVHHRRHAHLADTHLVHHLE